MNQRKIFLVSLVTLILVVIMLIGIGIANNGIENVRKGIMSIFEMDEEETTEDTGDYYYVVIKNVNKIGTEENPATLLKNGVFNVENDKSYTISETETVTVVSKQITADNVGETDTYHITEISAPDGYKKYDEIIGVNVTKRLSDDGITYVLDTATLESESEATMLEIDETTNTITITVVNEEILDSFSFIIANCDSETSAALVGAQFKVNSVTHETDEMGEAVIEDNTQINAKNKGSVEKYEISQVSGAQGYSIYSKSFVLNIYKEDNIDEYGEITGYKIKSVCVEDLYGDTVFNIISGEEPTICEDDYVWVDINNEDNTVYLTIYNNELTGNYNVQLKCQDEKGNVLSGVDFQITSGIYILDNENMTCEYNEEINSYTTNESGIITIAEDISIGQYNLYNNDTYKIIETQGLSGYLTYEDEVYVWAEKGVTQDNTAYTVSNATTNGNEELISVEVDSDNHMLTIIIVNKEITGNYDLVLSNLDMNTVAGLSGAEFLMEEQVYVIENEDGSVALAEDIKITKDNCTIIDTYELKQTKATNGYLRYEGTIELKVTKELATDGKSYLVSNAEVFVDKDTEDADIYVDVLDSEDGEGQIILLSVANDEIRGNYSLEIAALGENSEALGGTIFEFNEETYEVGETGEYALLSNVEITKDDVDIVDTYELKQTKAIEGYLRYEETITLKVEKGLSADERYYIVKNVVVDEAADEAGIYATIEEDEQSIILSVTNEEIRGKYSLTIAALGENAEGLEGSIFKFNDNTYETDGNGETLLLEEVQISKDDVGLTDEYKITEDVATSKYLKYEGEITLTVEKGLSTDGKYYIVKNVMIDENAEDAGIYAIIGEDEQSIILSVVNEIDLDAPVVVFDTLGNTDVSKVQSTAVTVNDKGAGVDEDSLCYVWTETTEEPEDELFVNKFINGEEIIKADGDGEWYLWIKASDKFENTGKYVSEVFVFDNTPAELKVQYSTQEGTNEDVTVTITANEEVQAVEGWELSEDKLKLTKVYEGNTEETITVYDLVGNDSETTISISNIDKVAPTLEVSYSTTKATNENVTVTITANEEIQAVEGWELSEDKLKLTKVYEGNTEETITVYDLVGNDSETTISISNIDKVSPTLEVSYSTTKATNENVTVTITANEEVQVIEGWELSEDKLTLTKVYEENTEETITVYDLVGNDSEATISISNIDKVKPTLEVSYNTQEVTNENVIVTITASKEMQAVEGWELSEDKLTLTKVYEVNTEETVTVYDLVGNDSEATISISNIDKVSPTLEVSYSTKEAINENVTVTIIANEKVQDVEGWELSEDQLTLTKVYEGNTEETITVYDLIGNDSEATISISNIDKVAPTLEVSYSAQEVTNENVTVTITANEEVQIVEGWELSEDQLTLTKVYEENTEDTITVYDLVGNDSEATISISNIDKVAPTLEVSYSTKELTYENITVTITANEEVQVIEGWELSEDKLILTKVYSSNTTENLEVYDLAGNMSEVTISINNILEGIRSDVYEISEKYILKVSAKTKVEDFLNNIKGITGDVITKNYLGEELTEDDLIGTGATIELENGDIYIIVVSGDLNGDGKIRATDLSKLMATAVKMESLEGVFFMAADMNSDGEIKASDVSLVRKILISQ